jgi:signal transduction histidine kinase/Fe-S-cluster-containing hydrogenase component 2
MDHGPIIHTLQDRCKRCYSCVRRCPAKAIRVQAGQAEVIEQRCIGCGRCVRACSQGAKRVASGLPLAEELSRQGDAVLLLAPSFPAAFEHWRPFQVIAAARRAGFSGVHEVAFGADLVALDHRRRYEREPGQPTITSACPAAVAFIQKYAVELVPFLAPVLSPMAAMGKALKTVLRPGCQTVFVGPCTAKIRETRDADVAPWVDCALTFPELAALCDRKGIDPALLPDEDYDPPYASLGGIFPIPGGLARVAELPSDLLENHVFQISGIDEFVDGIERMRERAERGVLLEQETRLFDVLFCKGCVAGPLMPSDGSLLVRKERVVAFMRACAARRTAVEDPVANLLRTMDISRHFEPDNQRRTEPTEGQIREILARTGKHKAQDELNCRACGYRSCREKAVAVYHGVAEVDMCLPFLVEKLVATIGQLNRSHEELTEAHAQVVRVEKLASMGQLAAGIAHEVNNPLGAILLYSHLLQEALDSTAQPDFQQVRGDIHMILQEATRCRGIVGGLLDFARQSKVQRAPVHLSDLIDDTIRVSRTFSASDAVRVENHTPAGLPLAHVDRDQMLQVLTNMVRNACEVMPSGGTICLRADWLPDRSEFLVTVRDEGPGIPDQHMSKLFTPFFTTKDVGKGTGLGLAISYGIVKMHRGSIVARNNTDGPGATFEITLPAVSQPGDCDVAPGIALAGQGVP